MELSLRKESEQLQKTTIPSLQAVTRHWYFLDLKDKIVGKIAPKITELLRGKNRSDFIPNCDLGNYVVLINAKHLAFSGNNKLDNKKYRNHSGYPGGLRERTLREMLEKYPRELVFRIVKGMMPKTKLGDKQITRLFIYPTDKHDKQAQAKNFIKLIYGTDRSN